MAKTTAQRQAEFRARRPMAGDNGERRLSLWVSTSAALALDRLVRRYRVTKREMIERLIKIEDDGIIGDIDLNSVEWDEYFEVAPPRSK